MKNYEIAAIFKGIANILEIKNESPFRVRAYQKAARSVENLTEDIALIAQRGDLTAIPGIGKDLAQKIKEVLTTGTLKKYEELKKEIPSGLVEFLNIPGVGPRTAKELYEKLGVTSLEELERLAQEQKLRNLPGIKAKTEENILKGITLLRKGRARFPLGSVLPQALNMVKILGQEAPVEKISLAGSTRRWKETVKDIDLLVSSPKPKEVMSFYTSLPIVAEVLVSGPTKTTIRTNEGLQCDLRVVEKESYGAALCYFTGSKAHNIRLRELANGQGLNINEYGVFKEERLLGGATEEEVFAAVGLPFIPPELREDRGEIEAAASGKLPRLVDPQDIKGDFHVHSKYSDGANTIEEIAAKARQMGLEWVAICDHSPSLRIARGVEINALKEKIAQIKAFNQKSRDVKLLCGAEVDINLDGNLDYPDEVLKELDLVIAAIHTGFKQDEAIQTKRLLAAINHPYVHIIAHPTGRLLGEREPYPINLELICRAAAQAKKALEINAYYKRLDLNDLTSRAAAGHGVKLCIGTDAHAVEQMEFLQLGLRTARRGWLEAKDVLNTLSYRDLTTFLAKKEEV
jgi:DNA polymerase (family 10)